MKGYQRSLLIDASPLQVIPALAKAIGLNEAIVLQQIHYWLPRAANAKGGRPFVYKTAEKWLAEFPFWSVSTVRRTLKNLRDRGLVIFDKRSDGDWDRTNWYSIDYDALNSLNVGMESDCANASTQSDQMHTVKVSKSIESNCADRFGQVDQMNIHTEITSETTNRRGGVAARATRLSPDWQLPKALGDWALKDQPTWTADHVRRVAENFRDHWIAVPGQRGTKLDWPATWRKWVRSEGAMKATKNGARAKPWFLGASGITEKGRARGFDIPADARGWDAFKAKVYEAEGVTPEMIRTAQVDHA
jgi:hypothetical protein